jgi:quercetin dioxygenase-like cupin family protein
VIIEGESTEVSAGDSVFIHGNIEHMAVNTGDKVLRLLYFFATDSFKDVVYRFPELNQDK